MSEQATISKTHYFAGESVAFTVSAPDAQSVSVVYGNSSVALVQNDGVWSGRIQTNALIGPVNWTAFATGVDGDVRAVGHGTFFVRCAGRSKLWEVVAAIDEAVKTWGTNPNRSVQIGEINISYKSLNELLAVRSQYVQRAEAEESGGALTGGLRVVEVSFT